MKINYDELLDFSNIEIEGDTKSAEEILEYEEILFEISNSIKRYRKENKLSQQQLAEILDVEQAMISKIESGNYNPTFKQLYKISRKLTESTSLFLEVLENIICNLNEMYEYRYSVNIVQNTYSDSKKGKDSYNKYKYGINESQGGLYGTTGKCRILFSNAA
jgi:DNA-binding helix-turn-helix protein